MESESQAAVETTSLLTKQPSGSALTLPVVRTMSFTIASRNRATYAIEDLSHTLPAPWKTALVTNNGNLSKAALQRNIDAKKKVPDEFLQAFKAKYPDFKWPDWTPEDTDDAQVPLDASGHRVVATNAGNKRKFTWLIHEWAGDTDELNKRNKDGTLIALTGRSGVCTDSGIEVKINEAVPDDMIDHWNAIREISGQIFYDAENLALGSLDKKEYMLVPSNWDLRECPVKDIGAGLNVYQVPIPIMAAIYVLAKQQAEQLGMTEDDRIKWAVLRLEAYKAGWFAHQKYTMFKNAPENCTTIMLADAQRIRALMKNAYVLCAFLPFMLEYYFRAFGAGYTKGNASDYIRKATELATSANLVDCLSYMDQDNLYGRALSWIGLRRPMLVLKDEDASLRIPNPFRIRAYSAPAGQAIITTSIAVINSIRAAGWWDAVKKAGGYDDSTLMAAAEMISKDPWKFHLMYNLYGVVAPTADEKRQIEEARLFAQNIAPVLQAYTDTIMKNTPLGRIQALKKYANQNPSILRSATSLFNRAGRARADTNTIQQVFASGAFRITGGQ